MSVMTPLTFYLALADPVSDCGCFGDAVSLTNWETFGKNVVLLGLSVLVFRYRRLMVRFVSERNQWMISLYSIFLPLFWRVSVSIIFRFSISVLIISE